MGVLPPQILCVLFTRPSGFPLNYGNGFFMHSVLVLILRPLSLAFPGSFDLSRLLVKIKARRAASILWK